MNFCLHVNTDSLMEQQLNGATVAVTSMPTILHSGRTAPDPPSNLSLPSMMESTECNSPIRNIRIKWEVSV